MTLTPTFSLTPRNSYYGTDPYDTHQRALLYTYGAYVYPKVWEGHPKSFDRQHAEDKLFFWKYYAANAALDYTSWQNIRIAPHVRIIYDLSSLGTGKELALIFGFEALSESRLLIGTYQGLLSDETLVPGDNQFLMEVETLDYLVLYFIHTRLEGFSDGGDWFFKGISGYVV